MEKEILTLLQNDRLNKLLTELKIVSANAPAIDECGEEENDMYSDVKNLIESIEYYLESKGIY